MDKILTPSEVIKQEASTRGVTTTALAETLGVNPGTFLKIADGSDRLVLLKIKEAMQTLGYGVEIHAVKLQTN